MVKDDWTPLQVLQTRNSSNIFVHSDLAWTWWKMIELHPGTADQKLTNIFYIQI